MLYTCTCCGDVETIEDSVPLGHICRVCGWEWDDWEESDRPDPHGPNGMHVSRYRELWYGAGCPSGSDLFRWRDAIPVDEFDLRMAYEEQYGDLEVK